MGQPILGNDLFTKWCEACNLPENCTRMVIDLNLDGVVKVYYECLGDERFLDLEPPSKGLKIRVKEIGGSVDEVHALGAIK